MLKHLLKAASIVSLLTLPAFSIGGGAGFHWGFDWTTTMPDATENIGPKFNYEGLELPDEITTMLDTIPFLTVSRDGFERGAINFGGKAFINLRTVPLDVEASFNFGSWRYNGAINYLDVSTLIDESNPTTFTPSYIAIPLNMKTVTGKEFFGLDKTPYAKLHLDLTIKKTFKPKVIGRFIQPSIGAGATIHFETPVLSEELIQNALDVDVSSFDPSMFMGETEEEKDLAKENLKKILDEITESGKEPKMGMHFLVGASIKPPLIPLGFYVDGKYNIVFNNDKYLTETNGFLVNAGIMFKIGS